MASATTTNTFSARKKRNKKKICAAWGCNNYQNVNKEVSYFRFPKDIEGCKKWVHKLRRADFNGFGPDQLKTKIVCGKHFDMDQFTNPEHR